MYTAEIYPSDRFIVQPDQKLIIKTAVQWYKILPEKGIIIFISCKDKTLQTKKPM